MKTVDCIRRNLCIVASCLGLPFLLSAPAMAAPPVVSVKVKNDEAHPVPVTIQQIPYQEMRSVADSSTCAPQCVFTYSDVPEGMRLVLTHVSGQVGNDVATIVLEGGDEIFFVAKSYPEADYVNTVTTFYYEPGLTPTARMFIQDGSQHNSLLVTLVGYYMPLP